MSESSIPYRIGIAGLGTVGAGVVKVLQENADLVEQRAGRPVEIVSVTASNKNKDRGVDLSSYDWANSLHDMASDPRLNAVIELIGGADGDAKKLVEEALTQGKDVVTANKALLAHHGYELAQLAEKNMATLAYEAAVAGGIPIIKSLREGLSANQIESLYGILNGTCNYILSEMRETGRDFDDVLQEAQQKGYAEADPTFDVDGIDAAHKLVLLGALAFGVKPDFSALDIQGIRHITSKDIKFADELGYRIKLLGMARRVGEKVMQSMEPCLVPLKSALGNVEGVFNAVLTEGNYVDKTMME
ncbi:MAG TPA: homoserine dehydrogenase, partial [Alphaproteobacteria bacterium]|nr:homoserine dehydrogenase [Alphaproteobacteria bacterium]